MAYLHKLSCRLALLDDPRALLVALAGAMACERATGLTNPAGGGTAPVASVTVSPATASVTVGQTVQLTATPKDSAGTPLTGRTVTWTSSNTGMATVSGTGLVKGVATGSPTITATSEGQGGTATVTVATSAASGCGTPQPGWIWCDDFEQNRLASYYEYDSGGGNFVPVAVVGRSGGTAMRARFAIGTVNPGSLHLAFGKTPRSYFKPVDAGTAIYRELYWRFYYKAQSPWTGGNPNKLTRALSFVDPVNFNSVVYAQLWGYGTTDFLALDPASGTDAAGNVVTTGWNDFAHMRWLGAKPGATPFYDAAHVGQWYCIETHVRLNDPGQSNGVFGYSLDGLLDAQETGLNWVGSYQTYGLNALFLEGYWNTGSPVAQDMFFDDFVVSTQPIGC